MRMVSLNTARLHGLASADVRAFANVVRLSWISSLHSFDQIRLDQIRLDQITLKGRT